MKNFQREITLPAFPRGFHLITQSIARELPEIGDIDVGNVVLDLDVLG